MALDTRTLDLLVAKDSLQEPQWISDDALAFLLKVQGQSLIHIQDSLQTRVLSSGSIGSSTAYASSSILSAERGLYALQTVLGQSRLLFRAHGSDSFQTAAEWEQASSDLHRGPHAQSLGWILSPSGGPDALVSFSSQKQTVIHSQEGYIRFVVWHPQRPILAFLSWEKSQLPWHSARLLIGDFKDLSGSPVLQTVRPLAPPGLEKAPCAEFEFCGDQLLASFQSDEYFQIWAYHLDLKHWRQLTDGASERALPWRKQRRRMFCAHAKTGQAISLKGDRGFWQMESLRLDATKPEVQTIPLPQLTALQEPQFSPSGQRLLLMASGARIQPSILRLHKEKGAWHLPRPPQASGSHLQAEAMSWPGFDGKTVHGILYRDRNRSTPAPLLMPLHGGPAELVSATWPAKAQAFVQLGYSVLYLNYRGSWGYGKTYHQALAGRWGQLEVDDAASAVHALGASAWIDKSRVALWGGGMASYSVLWGLIRYPELFKAGVAVFPLLNLQTYVAQASPAQKAELLWALGTLDTAQLAERSPLAHAQRIKSALALFHGQKDQSLSLENLETLEASLKSRQIPCWTTIYPDEGGSWQQRQTYDDYYCKVASFFARFLRFPEK